MRPPPAMTASTTTTSAATTTTSRRRASRWCSSSAACTRTTTSPRTTWRRSTAPRSPRWSTSSGAWPRTWPMRTEGRTSWAWSKADSQQSPKPGGRLRLMGSLRPSLCGALLAAALLPAAALAQDVPVTIQHGFPLAGGELVLVVNGLAPGEDVALRLLDAVDAPISLIEELSASTSPQFVMRPDATVVASVWRADARGRILLEVPLDDPSDVDKSVQLEVIEYGGRRLAALELRVQPPMLVLPSEQGLARLSLLDGQLLQPFIPAEGGLRGMARSADGLRGVVLRDGGLLETLAARDWAGAPLSTRAFDPATDVLAGGPAGAAFLLARPGGQPFPAAGNLFFPDEG